MYAAVDIGGTKTLIAVFDAHGQITEQKKFPTNPDYDIFLEDLTQNVAKLSTKEFDRVSVGMPGKIDRKHGVGLVSPNLPWLEVPVLRDAEKLFGCPGSIENDAKLAALSEARRLNGEYKKVLYLTISTGIGGGLITNGKIDKNFQDLEPGMMLLEHQGHLRRWEEFASGSAIYKKYGLKASEITDEQAWYAIARNLAVGIIDLVATLTPEVIIFGGGVGSHFDKFKDRLTEQLKLYENPLVTIPPLVGAQAAEAAVIFGCYELAKDKHHATHR